MKKITLFCGAGMSTSMLVNKMKQEASKQGKEYEIAAYSLSQMEIEGPGSDVILLGPQVRFAIKRVQDAFPDIPTDAIDMRTYGLMDGKGCLEIAEKMMK